uniref:Ribosomal RNA small subunit methyltransferase E n=1 Tax=Desulfatirhabdium butyrativorans TaxID=340467 RepID=A0A7C4MP55_9BACT
MRRFWIPSDRIQETNPVLDGEEAFHLIRVLRARSGQTILLMDGRGSVAEACIQSILRDRVALTVMNRTHVPETRPFRIVVAQALLKDAYMEDLIRRWVELGADECFAFVSERSVPILEDDRGRKRKQRWNTLAREAMKQSGNPYLPTLHEPIDMHQMMDALRHCPVKLLFWENESRMLSREIFSLPDRMEGRIDIGVVFGPEGGISESEVATFQQHGFQTVSLGPRILRAVTAGIVGVGLVGFLAEEALSPANFPPPGCSVQT